MDEDIVTEAPAINTNTGGDQAADGAKDLAPAGAPAVDGTTAINGTPVVDETRVADGEVQDGDTQPAPPPAVLFADIQPLPSAPADLESFYRSIRFITTADPINKYPRAHPGIVMRDCPSDLHGGTLLAVRRYVEDELDGPKRKSVWAAFVDELFRLHAITFATTGQLKAQRKRFVHGFKDLAKLAYRSDRNYEEGLAAKRCHGCRFLFIECAFSQPGGWPFDACQQCFARVCSCEAFDEEKFKRLEDSPPERELEKEDTTAGSQSYTDIFMGE